jgi:hypothetical protein
MVSFVLAVGAVTFAGLCVENEIDLGACTESMNAKWIGVATISAYPGYSGNSSVRGTVEVSRAVSGAGSLYKYSFAGLSPAETGSWHVHQGKTCDDANLVEGKITPAGGSDPWVNRWKSDSKGQAHGEFSIAASLDVVSHALVVHLPDGTRAGCGVISPCS